jgi:hypothetical protein
MPVFVVEMTSSSAGQPAQVTVEARNVGEALPEKGEER